MNNVLLPDLRIWLDEQRADLETLLSFVDQRSMMLGSFVPETGHELHSSYVDAGRRTIVASHLLVAADLPARPSTETIADRTLTRPGDRRHCLLEHVALLRDALEREGRAARVEVGDAALRIADGTSMRSA